MINVVIRADVPTILAGLPEDAEIDDRGLVRSIRHGAEMVVVVRAGSIAGLPVFVGQGTMRALLFLAGLGAQVKRIRDLTVEERDLILANTDLGFALFDGVPHVRIRHVLAGRSHWVEVAP